MLRSGLKQFSALELSKRSIKRYAWTQRRLDVDGAQGWDHEAFTNVDRNLTRFHQETAMPSVDGSTTFETAAKVLGNGWVIHKRSGINKKKYRQNATGQEFAKYMNRRVVASNHHHTMAHKLIPPNQLRQRWTVSDPFKGYDDEAHMWYVPDVPVDDPTPKTAEERRQLYVAKKQWPTRAPCGRLLEKAERRSDKTMHDTGKPNPNHNSDRNSSLNRFSFKHNISLSDFQN